MLVMNTSCSTIKLAYDVNGPVSKLFYASYDQVWKSVMLAMESYSLEEEDKEKGYLRTEVIQGSTLWKLPLKISKEYEPKLYYLYSFGKRYDGFSARGSSEDSKKNIYSERFY